MKRLGFFIISVAIASMSCSDAATFSKRGRIDRVKYYTQKYRQECKPQLVCTAECQDLYDFLRREGVELGGPCGPR